MAQRAKELNISELYQGITDKPAMLLKVSAKFNVPTSEVAYIGDDLNDLECIRLCGYSACPADAVPDVLSAVDYVCQHAGGRGAVREFIDHLSHIVH